MTDKHTWLAENNWTEILPAGSSDVREIKPVKKLFG